MGNAQSALELVYALRSDAMGEIAEKMSTALGDVGAEKATEKIAKQMRLLLASDVLYSSVTRPEINNVLADNGIEGDEVPESEFLPGRDRMARRRQGLHRARHRQRLDQRPTTPGIHGLGLIVDQHQRHRTGPGIGHGSRSGEETPEVEVEVQNQGESTENGVTVSVSAGGTALQERSPASAPAKRGTVTIPLTPAPEGTVTLEVNVEPVPGEKVSENNEASYTVEFG